LPLLLLLLLVFLIPLGLYCLILAGINRRPHPVLVSGTWDCIGLLFGVSGFFLGVIPGLAGLLYSNALREPPFLVVLAYFFLVAFGAVLAVWQRGKATVIYNINPEDWEKVFAAVLARFDMEQTRSGKHISLGGSGIDDAHHQDNETAIQAKPHLLTSFQRTAVLRVDSFPALNNVTLHWEHVRSEFREQIEAELTAALKTVETLDNPAGSWLLGIGGSIVTMVFFTVLVLVLLWLRRHL
jgi:hypothetical protein